jgi:hypothetical protein
MNLFVIPAQAPKVKITSICRGIIPFLVAPVDPHRAYVPVSRLGALAAEGALRLTEPAAHRAGAPGLFGRSGRVARRLKRASASDSKMRGFAVDEVAPCVTRRPQKSPVGVKIRASSLPETGSGPARVIFVQQWSGND